MHDVVIVGIPLIAILAGILFSRSDTKNMRAELRGVIGGLRSEINIKHNEIMNRFSQIDGDLR